MLALTTRIKVKDAQGRIVDEKEVATYAGLLSRAHDEGLKSIITDLVQAPTPANKMVAIAKAQVTTSKGVYHGIGDASPENVNKKIVPHIVRMAETRAKARALRDAVNIGVVSLEELGGDEGDATVSLADHDEHTRGHGPHHDNDRRPNDRNGGSERRDEREAPRRDDSRDERPPAMTDNQRRYLFRLLADEGYEGTAAGMRLCDAAGVESLRDITKAKASSLIDEWSHGREQPNGR